MARKPNDDLVQEAAWLISAHPGQRSGDYARLMGCHREAFNRLLVQMNDRGILLWEDDRGGLWPFGDSWQKR